MQQHEKKQSTPEPVSEFQRALNSLISLGEDVGESRDDIHVWLDDFFEAYLIESLNFKMERDEMIDHFRFYSYLQKVLRLAKESYNTKTLKS